MIKQIWSWIFPYSPTEHEAKQYYKDGNGYFDKMTGKEKEEFKKPIKDLPLGL